MSKKGVFWCTSGEFGENGAFKAVLAGFSGVFACFWVFWVILGWFLWKTCGKPVENLWITVGFLRKICFKKSPKPLSPPTYSLSLYN